MSDHGEVSSRQFAAYDRWDAQFHLAVQRVGARIKEIERRGYDTGTCIERLAGLRTEDLKALEPLLTGNQRVTDRTALVGAIKKYPYLSLALVELTAEGSIERVEREIEAAGAYRERLIAIARREG